MDKFFTYIDKYTNLDQITKDELLLNVDVETFDKGDIVLRLNQVCDKVWFIDEGMVRRYRMCDSYEKTIWIFLENEMFTSLDSYLNSVPSIEIFEAIEPTTLYSISKTQEEKLIKFPKYLEFVTNLQKSKFSCMDNFSNTFHVANPKEKYEYLLKNAPDLIKKVKLGYIASIMGVTQETLSRVRAKY